MTEAPVPTETLMAPPSPVASVDAICADYLVVRAVWPNRSAAGGAES